MDLTPYIEKYIAATVAEYLSEKCGKAQSELTISVGHDSRLSADMLKEGVLTGIQMQGCKPVDCSLASTPSMFMSTVLPELSYDGAIMITASHLPFNRNGVKFFDKDGGLEHDDITEILEYATKVDSAKINETDISACEQFNLVNLYAEHLKKTICKELGTDYSENAKPLAGLKFVVDAGNGAGGFFATEILQKLGADIEGSQFLDPDGSFPNHIPNPENKEAMQSIRNATVNNKADLGLIFDTDVDRMSAVLANGEEVNRDAIIAMISAILAPDYPNSTIITDSVTSDRLTYFLEDVLGLKHLCYMRGYKNVINKCKELNNAGVVSPLAMETSGHGALKDNYYLDDGAFLAVKLVIAVAKAKASGKTIDSLIEKLPPLVEEGEYRFKITTEDFKSYGKNVLQEFKARAEKAGYALPQSFEGVRISFKEGDAQGWILLRMSLHDPVMPMNIEGARKGDLAKLVKIAQELMSGFDSLDISCLK